MGYRNDWGLIHAPMLAGVERLLDEPMIVSGAEAVRALAYLGAKGTTTALPCEAGEDMEVYAFSGIDIVPGEPLANLDAGARMVAAGNYYRAPSVTTVGDVRTKDIIWEWYGLLPSTTRILFDKMLNSVSEGLIIWFGGVAGTCSMRLNHSGGTSTTDASSVMIAGGAVVAHMMGWIDRDEASVNGSGFAHNGVAAGGGVDFSAHDAQDITSGVKTTLGGFSAGSTSQCGDQTLGLFQLWLADDVLPGGAGNGTTMTAIAKARAALLMGHALIHNHGSLTPAVL